MAAVFRIRWAAFWDAWSQCQCRIVSGAWQRAVSWAQQCPGMGFGVRVAMRGDIADRIEDGSKGYLLDGMDGGMLSLAVVLYKVLW